MIEYYKGEIMTLKEKFDILSDEKKREQFFIYFSLLKEWNDKFNLTAITEKEQVYVKHFADSIAAMDMIDGKILDVGAGAGFPSIPLKIMKPSVEVTMLDSLNKRVIFLNETIKKLGLENIRAIHTRAEDFKERESFDHAVARAVAPLSTLAEYTLPFIKTGGTLIAYKSENIEDELKSAEKAIETLGGKKAKIVSFMLDEKTARKLIVIEKIKQTPMKYPRSQNKPRTSPIR